MVQVNTAVLEHRIGELEKEHSDAGHDIKALEARVRALEIAWAKLVGLSAGGAAVGGAFVQLLTYLLGK